MEARVARGVALLDERVPGWWERVEVLGLHMGSTCRCVLGQVFDKGGKSHLDVSSHGYFLGTKVLNPDAPASSAWAEAHGFDRTEAEYDDAYVADDEGEDPDTVAYPALQAEWTRVIKSRRVSP